MAVRLQFQGCGFLINSIEIWRGERLEGKRLLLCHEHGFGDSIQHLRFIPLLLEAGASVTFVAPQPLRRLVENNFEIEVIDEVKYYDAVKFDYRCGLTEDLRKSVHRMIGCTAIPSPPYLATTHDPVPYSIGVCWSGNTQRNVFRCDTFLDKIGLPDYRYFALQFERPHVAGVELLDAKDFWDTLNLIGRLQHIITVDTAVAHLAAAAGHPSVYLVLYRLPIDPRWDDTNWYPNVKVWRKPLHWDMLRQDIINQDVRRIERWAC